MTLFIFIIVVAIMTLRQYRIDQRERLRDKRVHYNGLPCIVFYKPKFNQLEVANLLREYYLFGHSDRAIALALKEFSEDYVSYLSSEINLPIDDIHYDIRHGSLFVAGASYELYNDPIWYEMLTECIELNGARYRDKYLYA